MDFAHCINPVRQFGTEYVNCDNSFKGGSKGKKGLDLLKAYPKKPFDKKLINLAQQTIFIYTLKIIRWSFYTKQNKAMVNNIDDENKIIYNNVLIDYIMTMMIALIAYAINNSTLFYAILLDEIMSVLMFLKTKDKEVLLVPYFIVFHGIDMLN